MTMTLPYVEARWGYKSRRKKVRLIILHSAETDQGPRIAEAVANYFHTTDRKASAHVVFDENSGVECYKPNWTAFGAAGANSDGYQIEHAGRAKWDVAHWTDADSAHMLARSAQWAAQKAKEFGIPAVWLSVADVRAGKKGFTDHATISAAYPDVSTGHTDPGKNFPHGTYLGMVKHFLSSPTPAPKPTGHKHSMPVVTSAKNAKARRVTTYTAKGAVVKDLQGHLNVIFKGVKGYVPLVCDGGCGDKTVAAIIKAQGKYRLTKDGVCGPTQTWPKIHTGSGGKRINEKGQAF